MTSRLVALVVVLGLLAAPVAVAAGRVGADGEAAAAIREGRVHPVVRRQAPDGFLAVDLNEVVDLIFAAVLGRRAEGLGEPRRRGRRLLTLGRKVELDPLAGA